MPRSVPLRTKRVAKQPIDVFIDALRTVVAHSNPRWSDQHLYGTVVTYTNTQPLLVDHLDAGEVGWKKTNIVKVEPRRPIYLPPLAGDPTYLPLLICDWDFGSGTKPADQRSLRLKMVREWNAESQALDAADRRVRIASVHLDAGNPGEWNFFHLQLTQRPTPHMKGVYHKDADWLPSELPRIPLPAAGPSELLLCVLVGLYGPHDDLVAAVHGAIAKHDQCNMMTSIVKNATA